MGKEVHMDEVYLAISFKQCRPKANGFKVTITEQKFTGSKFVGAGNSFTASNGFRLESCNCPEMKTNMLYVRGSSYHLNTEEFIVPADKMPALLLTISEYNSMMNNPLMQILSSPRQRLLSFAATFYILIELETKGYNSFQFRAYTKQFEKVFAKMLFDYTVFVCMGESRHSKAQTREEYVFPELLPPNNGDNRERHRHTVYLRASEYDPMYALELMEKAFNEVRWGDEGSFGGKKWGHLAGAGRQYGSISDRVFIDSIVHLQHNNGTIFNKPIFFEDELTDEYEYKANGVCIRRIDAFLERRGKANGDPIEAAAHLYIPVTKECLDFIQDAAGKGLVEVKDYPVSTTLNLTHNIEYGNKKLVLVVNDPKDDPRSDGDDEFVPDPDCDCPQCKACYAKQAKSVAVLPSMLISINPSAMLATNTQWLACEPITAPLAIASKGG
jgi:hypothetical protein